MIEAYEKITQKGGEGIMIKQAESAYCDGRSSLMLKLKPSFDEEGVIVDYTKGKGKYLGLLGGFV